MMPKTIARIIIEMKYRLRGRFLNFAEFSNLMKEQGGTLIGIGRMHWWTKDDLVNLHPRLPWKQGASMYDKNAKINLFWIPEQTLRDSFEQSHLSLADGRASYVSLTKYKFYNETEFYDDLIGDFPKLTVVLGAPKSSKVFDI